MNCGYLRQNSTVNNVRNDAYMVIPIQTTDLIHSGICI